MEVLYWPVIYKEVSSRLKDSADLCHNQSHFSQLFVERTGQHSNSSGVRSHYKLCEYGGERKKSKIPISLLH